MMKVERRLVGVVCIKCVAGEKIWEIIIFYNQFRASFGGTSRARRVTEGLELRSVFQVGNK